MTKGKVHVIGTTQQVSDTFKKRELVLEIAENPTYPEYVKFDLLQDKTALLDNVKVGDEVEIDYNLRGRAWTNKEGITSYFNSLVVWKLNVLNGYIAPTVATSITDDDSGLPF